MNINEDHNEDRIIFFQGRDDITFGALASFMSDRSARTTGAHAMFHTCERPSFF